MGSELMSVGFGWCAHEWGHRKRTIIRSNTVVRPRRNGMPPLNGTRSSHRRALCVSCGRAYFVDWIGEDSSGSSASVGFRVVNPNDIAAVS